MNDIVTKISSGDSTALTELFKMGAGPVTFSPDALQESLEHVLSIGIDSALNQLPRKLAVKLRQSGRDLKAFSATQASGISTFGELLKHPNPPLAMLKFAKDFGKAICRHDQCIWPHKVGEVLYYGAYAAGLMRLRERVGTFKEQDLQKPFRKLAARAWIDESLRRLFEQAANV